MKLDGKRCLITGGSRGLGLTLGRVFAEEGARVAFTYSNNDEDAADARESLGEDSLSFKGSVADADHASDTVAAVNEAWGGLDILVNNAGFTQVLPIALLEEKDWDRVLEVNAKGAYLFSRAALKPMIRAKAGHILNIGNFGSERIVDAPVHYAAAKSALRGFTESLAREVGRYNIKVNLLAPGLLDVGLSRALPEHRIREYVGRCPLGRIGTAEEVARCAAFLVSDANSFMSGAKIVLDGGL